MFAIAVLVAVALYLVAGVLFAVAYVRAIPAGPGFRAIIFPGVSALWPVLIRRWPK